MPGPGSEIREVQEGDTVEVESRLEDHGEIPWGGEGNKRRLKPLAKGYQGPGWVYEEKSLGGGGLVWTIATRSTVLAWALGA